MTGGHVMEWINQLVGRKSYGCDVLFRVVDVVEKEGVETAILYGSDIRLIADAPVNDLVFMTKKEIERIEEEWRNQEEESFHSFTNNTKNENQREDSSSVLAFHLPGRVLHLDGDSKYLAKCIDAYTSLSVPVVGVHCPEKRNARKSFFTDRTLSAANSCVNRTRCILAVTREKERCAVLSELQLLC